LKHVVMYSGGIGSWAAANRVVEQVGDEKVLLLFADVCMEDEDLYRFLDETVQQLGVELVRISDGRNPWQVFRDKRYIGNSRVDPCSQILKRELCFSWLGRHCDPKETQVYLGMDWTEIHRYERAKPYWEPWEIHAPLCEEPYVTKFELLDRLRQMGIRPPRLYEMGFLHNNCGGFCIKAGQSQFRHLLQTMPERYAYHEQEEELLRQYLDKNVAILRRKVAGKTIPLTLRQLRLEIENTGSRPQSSDEEEWGGCGCFTDV
jgi:hypothetical protein